MAREARVAASHVGMDYGSFCQTRPTIWELYLVASSPTCGEPYLAPLPPCSRLRSEANALSLLGALLVVAGVLAVTMLGGSGSGGVLGGSGDGGGVLAGSSGGGGAPRDCGSIKAGGDTFSVDQLFTQYRAVPSSTAVEGGGEEGRGPGGGRGHTPLGHRGHQTTYRHSDPGKVQT